MVHFHLGLHAYDIKMITLCVTQHGMHGNRCLVTMTQKGFNYQGISLSLSNFMDGVDATLLAK